MKYLVMVLCFLFFALPVQAKKVITIGAYDFPPYYEFVDGKHEGIIVEAIKILNSSQKEYVFEVQRLPSKQRYTSFQRGRVDMYMFEDPAWEWSKVSYEFIPLDVDDGEIYVTRKNGPPKPEKFEDLKKLKIALIKGYHYGFAGLDTDERYLRKNFRVELVADLEACLHLLKAGMVDVAVITKSFMRGYFKRHPAEKQELLTSTNYDSNYKLGVIFKPKGPISREKLEELIAKMKAEPKYQEMLEKRFKD